MKTLEIGLATSKLKGSCYEFFISGRPLRELVRAGGLSPRLGGEYQPLDSNTRDLLLLDAPGDLPSGRVALYVCEVCGNYDCGAIGVRIARVGSNIVWSDFAYESWNELHGIEKVGPFKFAEAEYRKAIAMAVYSPSSPMPKPP